MRVKARCFIQTHNHQQNMFKKPGVARAVLQTPLLLINSLIKTLILFENILKTLSLPNLKS